MWIVDLSSTVTGSFAGDLDEIDRHLKAGPPVAWRDHSGERGPVPTCFGPLSWQDARQFRRVFDKLRGYAGRPRRAPTGEGKFARGTFKVWL